SQSATATADDNGQFKAKLPPLAPGEASSLTVSGDKTDQPIVLKDVAVGDVWICSGQSNMQMAVKSAQNAEQEIASASDPAIRLFMVPMKTSIDPKRELDSGSWQLCTPQTVANFSAAGYFFGR